MPPLIPVDWAQISCLSINSYAIEIFFAAISSPDVDSLFLKFLCICRAFLKKSKLILIDEATANIDVRTDKLIQKVISTKFKASTVLTIAHRLETLKDSDKILVLGKGEVLEWGARKSLMSNP